MNRLSLIVTVCVCALAAMACGGANPDAVGTPSGVAPGQPAIDTGESKGGKPEGPARSTDAPTPPEKPATPADDAPGNSGN